VIQTVTWVLRTGLPCTSSIQSVAMGDVCSEARENPSMSPACAQRNKFHTWSVVRK
jgi:hypothetical protein